MWFCVMTFLSWHKELLSWICFVESWPQGFVREMNCSQVLAILRQFTVEPRSGWRQQQISVFFFGTNPFDGWNVNFLWEHMEQVWCGLNWWPEVSRRGYWLSEDGMGAAAGSHQGPEHPQLSFPPSLTKPLCSFCSTAAADAPTFTLVQARGRKH